jgi:hypothetical protein
VTARTAPGAVEAKLEIRDNGDIWLDGALIISKMVEAWNAKAGA